MKSLKVVLAATLALGLVACSQQEKKAEAQNETKTETPAAQAEMTSTDVTMTEVTPLADLMASPDQYVGKTVLIEGHVTGRCAHSGCWISLDTGDPENRLIVRTEDESFVFAADCVDKDVLVQGSLMVKTPQEEEHMEEGAEPHECPNPEYFFKPDAAKIKV